MRFHARGKFGDIQRLADHVGRAHRKTFHALFVAFQASLNEDGGVGKGWVGAEFAADLEPIHAWHHDIKQNNIRLDGFSQTQTYGAVVGFHDFANAHSGRDTAQQQPDDGIVINDQHRAGRKLIGGRQDGG
mgnify:CR=1 FL=1